MRLPFSSTVVSAAALCLIGHFDSRGQTPNERTERFDVEPKWEARNNRRVEPRKIRQDFGYSDTAHAGGKRGEIGGFMTAAAEPAYYAKKIPVKTFADRLSASGTIACTGEAFHMLIGFFNAGTLNEWRTPNTIAIRISGRGDIFYAWVEYAAKTWRAGADNPQGFPTDKDPQNGRPRFKGYASKGAVHRWSLSYDPNGNGGRGVVTATIDGDTAICNLDDGHKADGAEFNRFGLLNVMKSADGGGELWLDDIVINGAAEDFSKDPAWDGFQNRRSYSTEIIRPQFDFGFSPSNHAGGKGKGELGGVFFRGDCRYPERMASYADRVSDLSLEKPLRASGKVCLKRGVSDSGVLIGFFNAKESMAVSPSQATGLPESFFGISTDGPSREGFVFAPIYRVKGDNRGYPAGRLPRIVPDGNPHDWSMTYSPSAGGHGRVTVTLDEQSVSLDLPEGHRKAGSIFDRFGLITPWIDGNSQTIYFDDLTYTWKQD